MSAIAFENVKRLPDEELHSLQGLLLEQLRNLHDAERQLAAALPELAKSARNPELQHAFHEHHRETLHHQNRLEQAFHLLGADPASRSSKAIEGLVKEAKKEMEREGVPAVHDASLIAIAQRIEHDEISGYGTARELASRLGEDKVADLLDETLGEEIFADDMLTRIARHTLYPEAAMRDQLEA